MLAIDRYYYIDVHIFDSKLVKNAFARCRLEFLSAVFARFNVTFYLEYHCTAVSEVSRGKKGKRKSFSNSQGSGNGIHIQFSKL